MDFFNFWFYITLNEYNHSYPQYDSIWTTHVQPNEAILDFGETHSGAVLSFSKCERPPSARGAWTGNLSPFTKDQDSSRMRLSKIEYNLIWLYMSYPDGVILGITIDYFKSGCSQAFLRNINAFFPKVMISMTLFFLKIHEVDADIKKI